MLIVDVIFQHGIGKKSLVLFIKFFKIVAVFHRIVTIIFMNDANVFGVTPCQGDFFPLLIFIHLLLVT